MLLISKDRAASGPLSILVNSNPVKNWVLDSKKSDPGTSLGLSVHMVTCILSGATVVFLKIGPQGSVTDDSFWL